MQAADEAPLMKAGLGSFLPFQDNARVVVVTTVDGRRVQVNKDVKVGQRGGLYYINDLGKRVYLKDYQREKCVNGKLEYDHGVCSSDVPPVRQSQSQIAVAKQKRPYGGFVVTHAPPSNY